MFALRMAHREFRASWKKFAFAILAIGIGVGAVTGVQGFGRALKRSLLREGRQLIASDLLIRTSTLPKPEEMEALQDLKNQGAEITLSTETVSMVGVAAPLAGGTPILVSLKAVEAGYPYFGVVELQPSGSLHEVLKRGVVVSRDLLLRLGVEVGDRIRIGNAEFVIGAALLKEPDRIASGLEF